MARFRVAVWAAIVLACIAGLAALRRAASEDPSLSRVRAAGVLRMGYAVEPPYAYLSPEGVVTGLAPETARAVAARLGVGRIEWRLSEFGALLDELREGRIDVVATGMFITRPRAELAAFADPFLRAGPGLLVARGNPRNLHSFADAMAGPGVRVAALSGAVEPEALLRAGLPVERLVLVPDAQTGRMAVETGLAEALALSTPTLKWMAGAGGGGAVELALPFEPAGPEFDDCTGYGAFAFRKQDASLRNAWNREQREYLASGEHEALLARFGFGEGAMPGNVSAEEALKP